MNTTNQFLPQNGAINALRGGEIDARSAFHGMGVELHGVKDVREALHVAGLNWKVQSRPTYVEASDGSFHPLKSARALVREDGLVLGERVSDRYTPIQNEAVFDSLQAGLDQGLITLESAGAMQGGKRIYVLAKGITDARVRGVDALAEHQLFTFGHDGESAMRVIPSAYRIACANAIAAATRKAEKNGRMYFTIRHVGDVGRKVSGVVEAIQAGQRVFLEFAEVADLLAGTQMSVKDAHDFVKFLYPREDVNAELNSRIMAKRETIIDLFEQADGSYGHRDVRGTAWQMFNAVTEHANHASRGMSKEKREKALISLYEGVNASLAMRAMLGLQEFYVKDAVPDEFASI